VVLAIALVFIVNLLSVVNKKKYSRANIIFRKYGKKRKLKSIGRGIVAGTSYLLYNENNVNIYNLALTCSFMTHVYCYVGTDKIDQHLAEKNKLSRLVSNMTPSGFNIYCVEEDGYKLKQIFDTQVLSFLSEFCHDYDLEIVDNQLVYALKPGNTQKNEQIAQLADGELLYNMVNPKTIEWYRQIKEEFIL
jgi:hypothetical protein